MAEALIRAGAALARRARSRKAAEIPACLAAQNRLDGGSRRGASRSGHVACAPVAQLDRAPDYESGGQEFESLRARHLR